MHPKFKIEPFEGKLEDVTIYFHKMEIKLFTELVDSTNSMSSRFTGYSNIFHNVETHHYVNGKDIAGEIILHLRNQGTNFSLCLILAASINADSPSDNSGRSVFCKAMQYLFDWIAEYAKEKNIMDEKGETFIVPSFNYSKDRFTLIED